MIPEEAYGGQLTDYQFRLLAFLCHLKGRGGLVEASIDQLASGTGNVATKTVRRALQALETAGYIRRERTKKSGGKRGPDKVYLVDSTVPLSEGLGDSNVHATGDYVANDCGSLTSHMEHISQVSNKEDTSYLLHSFEVRRKEDPMKNYDDGEDLAGFGLIEPREQDMPKVKKSDPKTRGKRPQHEWTPMDVAAEFSFVVGRKFPWLPGTVNVFKLGRALAKYRNQYGTTALLELELLRLFMLDDSNFRDVGNEAPNLYKRYLSSFGTKLNKARENLGLPHLSKVEEPSESGTIGYVTAKDGRKFKDTIAGRAQLERYEKRLIT